MQKYISAIFFMQTADQHTWVTSYMDRTSTDRQIQYLNLFHILYGLASQSAESNSHCHP